MKSCVSRALTLTLLATCAVTASGHSANERNDDVKSAVDTAIQPAMEKYGIPGMAVGVIVAGRPYVFDYGVASKETGKQVTQDTLFELGSVSKTFTATLAAYAQVNHRLDLSDKTSKYLPSLRGSKFGEVSLLDLGTHTPGGLPLQVPDDIKDNAQLMKYFKDWQPTFAPGTHRTYANPSIGLLGLIAAKSMSQDFDTLMEQRIFSALGMKHSYLDVPKTDMANYAQGYTSKDAPIRMADAVLSAEAYGVKTTAFDMIRFVEANMDLIRPDAKLRNAIMATHTGYFQVGEMTQDLIWEQYSHPVSLRTLLAGNSSAVAYMALPVSRITPPRKPRRDVLLNKTGSTNGFGAYVAFIPEKKFGIVILANKNYPIDDRVAIAHQIMTKLGANEPRN